MAKLPRDQEVRQDAWARFERAVDVVAKSPPQHRSKSAPTKRKKRPSRKAALGRKRHAAGLLPEKRYDCAHGLCSAPGCAAAHRIQLQLQLRLTLAAANEFNEFEKRNCQCGLKF